MEHGVALQPHVVVRLKQTSINTDIWCCLRVRFEETPNCYCLIVCPIALTSCYGTHCRVRLSLLSFDIRFMCVLSCNCNLLHNCLHAEFRSCWYIFCRLFPLSILRYSWTDQRVKTFVSSISKFNFVCFIREGTERADGRTKDSSPLSHILDHRLFMKCHSWICSCRSI